MRGTRGAKGIRVVRHKVSKSKKVKVEVSLKND